MTSFPRKSVKWSTKQQLEFKAVDWIECDEIEEIPTLGDPKVKDETSYYDNLHNKKYVIFCFGVNAEGQSICVKIKNYTPYFYMRIPSEWTPNMIDEFNTNFLSNISNCREPAVHNGEDKWYPKSLDEKIGCTFWKSSLISKKTETVEKQIFWSFMNHRKFNFWKLYFQSKAGSKFYHQYLKEEHRYPVKLEVQRPNLRHHKRQSSTDITQTSAILDGYEAEEVESDSESIPEVKPSASASASFNSNINSNKAHNSDDEGSSDIKTKFKLFESDLEPLLRFYHDAKIQPSGWITIPGGKYTNTHNVSTCQINIEVDWHHIQPNERVDIPPMVVASFDIECDSSHGDFPVARKDLKKLANELVICWLRDIYLTGKYGKTEPQHIQAAAALANKDKYFRDRILQSLEMKQNVDDGISKIYLKDRSSLNSKIKGKLFEMMCVNIHMICDRPIRKVKSNKLMKQAVSLVQNRMDKLEERKLKEDKVYANIHDLIMVIKKVADEKGLDFIELRDKMITKEVLVRFVNHELKRFLPAVCGDPIIQIGTVFWLYGDPKPIYNNILTLVPKDQGCADIPGVDVESFESELSMLLRWSEMIKQYDPDIIVGYNIFGFDEAFMYDRIVELNPYDQGRKCYPATFDQFLNLGRMTEHTYKNIKDCRGGLLNKKLSSSALGDNYFYYFNMPGRVQIDLLKVAQSSMTKLPSYKLDSVAEFYIGGKVEGVGKLEAETCQWIKVSNIKLFKIGQTLVFDGVGEARKLCKVVEIKRAERLIQLDVALDTKSIPSSAKLIVNGENCGSGGNGESVEITGISATSKWLKLENMKELEVGNFIVITMNETNEQLYDGKKLQIMNIVVADVSKGIKLVEVAEPIPLKIYYDSPKWGIGKDDISPQDIFRLQKGSDADRALIAKYCIQDCALLIRLLKKLETISNNFGMSNVCLVPFSYIFMRGQGIKIFSLICNECAQEDFVLPVLDKIQLEEDDAKEVNPNTPKKLTILGGGGGGGGAGDASDSDSDLEMGGAGGLGGSGGASGAGRTGEFDYAENFNEIIMTDESYEGAIVLDPKPDFYTHPISILDFGSLYPSEMIASNLSHDSLCESPYWLGDEGAARIRALGYDFIDRSYDNYAWIDPDKRSLGKKKVGVTVARFVQFADGKKGLIPRVLQKLLKARKAMKKLMESFEKTDPGRAVVYEGLQLAYKLTANSLYGQIGAKTSKIYKAAIAASTTAGGRGRIIHAKNYVLEHFKGSEIVYGDTDSIFVKFDLRDESGVMPVGRAAVERAIKIGIDAEHAIQPHLPAPHVLEYEKVFYPMMLITKKRYAGDKYEFSPDKCKFTSMGIVLKRRDNAPILKYIYGGVIKILMKEMNVNKAVDFVKSACRDMLDDKFDIGMFVLSKTLRDYYKDPEAIAHKVLADRMAERDPGNKPACNERIPYAYIQVDEKTLSVGSNGKILQGDKIEHIAYIQDKGLKLDYVTYIENQLIKPISQIFELVVRQIRGYPYHATYLDDLRGHYMEKYKGNVDKVDEKISEKKQEIVYKLIFHDILMEAKNMKAGMAGINTWFKPVAQELMVEQEKPVVADAGVAAGVAKLDVKKKSVKQASIATWVSDGDGINADDTPLVSSKKKGTVKSANSSASKNQAKITAFFGNDGN